MTQDRLPPDAPGYAAPPPAATPPPPAATPPPPPAQLPGPEVDAWWYVAANGQRVGPVTAWSFTQLAASGHVASDTLVWFEGAPGWVPASATRVGQHLARQLPPTPGFAVSNAIVWTLAFAPTVGPIAEGFVQEATGTFQPPGSMWWVVLIVNTALGLWDERRLKQAGHKLTGVAQGWLVPVYLFQRAKALGQTPAYAWVWLVVFVLMLGW